MPYDKHEKVAKGTVVIDSPLIKYKTVGEAIAMMYTNEAPPPTPAYEKQVEPSPSPPLAAEKETRPLASRRPVEKQPPPSSQKKRARAAVEKPYETSEDDSPWSDEADQDRVLKPKSQRLKKAEKGDEDQIELLERTIKMLFSDRKSLTEPDLIALIAGTRGVRIPPKRLRKLLRGPGRLSELVVKRTRRDLSYYELRRENDGPSPPLKRRKDPDFEQNSRAGLDDEDEKSVSPPPLTSYSKKRRNREPTERSEAPASSESSRAKRAKIWDKIDRALANFQRREPSRWTGGVATLHFLTKDFEEDVERRGRGGLKLGDAVETHGMKKKPNGEAGKIVKAPFKDPKDARLFCCVAFESRPDKTIRIPCKFIQLIPTERRVIWRDDISSESGLKALSTKSGRLLCDAIGLIERGDPETSDAFWTIGASRAHPAYWRKLREKFDAAMAENQDEDDSDETSTERRREMGQQQHHSSRKDSENESLSAGPRDNAETDAGFFSVGGFFNAMTSAFS